MKKKTIWLLNALLFVVLLLLAGGYYMRHRPVSLNAAGDALSRLDASIRDYESRHGRPPTILSELEDSRLSTYRGIPIDYIKTGTNFELRLAIPPGLEPDLRESGQRAGLTNDAMKPGRSILIHTGEFKAPAKP